MGFLSVVSGLKPLALVYAVLAVGYLISRLAFRTMQRYQTYILSDSKGHTVTIILDSRESVEQRARIVNEKVKVLAAQDT